MTKQESSVFAAANNNHAETASVSGTMLVSDSSKDGVLIVEGMLPLDAVQVVERCGGTVYFARDSAGSAVLDVRMDMPTANRVALATLDHRIRYVPIEVAIAKAS